MPHPEQTNTRPISRNERELRRVYMTASTFIGNMQVRSLTVGENGVEKLTLHMPGAIVEVGFRNNKTVFIAPARWEMAE